MRIPLVLFLSLASVASGQERKIERDLIKTSKGVLEITFLGHGTLMLRLGARVVHVDPVARYADYTRLPKADLIVVTHEHGDHFDPAAIAAVSGEKTAVVLTRKCFQRLKRGEVMKNGERRTVAGFLIEAVPAYNIVHMRRPGQPFHPRGEGNGYVITFGDKKVYVAGDTENTPEMKKLRGLDVAFLPMNLPYTMTPEMVADAARAMRPRILYPYHYGKTDPARLVKLLEDCKKIEVRVRRMR